MQERLQKVLARAGVASRRHAEELITAGRVEVNGRRCTELGTRVDAGQDTIRVDGRLVADITDRVYYVLYKPAGCVTTLSDPEGRPTVMDHLRGVTERVYPVGRLDYDAEGALILTNDGELAHRLMHPKFGAKRTYLAKVKGEPGPQVIERLRAGVRLEDGLATPLEADAVSRADRNTWIRLVVAEGRPHLVKRLCEAVGHPVQRLFRASYSGVDVEGMMPGELRELSKAEVRSVREGGANDTSAPSGLPPRRDARRRGMISKAPGGALALGKPQRAVAPPAARPKPEPRTRPERDEPRPVRTGKAVKAGPPGAASRSGIVSNSRGDKRVGKSGNLARVDPRPAKPSRTSTAGKPRVPDTGRFERTNRFEKSGDTDRTAAVRAGAGTGRPRGPKSPGTGGRPGSKPRRGAPPNRVGPRR